MFEREKFRAVPDAHRDARLEQVNRILASASVRPAFRQAARVIVTHLYPDLEHWRVPFNELNRVLVAYGLPAIRSINTFTRFLRGGTDEPRRLPLAHLLVFCLDLRERAGGPPIETHPFDEKDAQLGGLFTKLGHFLVTGDASVLTHHSSTLAPSLPHPKETIEAIFRLLHNRDALQSDLYRYFFWPSQSEAEPSPNEAYYLCYRYSTVDGCMVKSFLVIKTPQQNDINQFSYLHIMQGGPTQGGTSGSPLIKRIGRGYILSFPVACYLVGRMERPIWGPDATETLDCIAIEYEHLRAQRPCVQGVILSAAASDQPVVGRIALVRLGDRVAFGKPLMHDIVQPTEIDGEKLRSDLTDVFDRLTREGYPLDPTRINPTTIHHLVQQYINNIPLWETSAQNPRNARGRVRMEGALEAWRNDMRD